MLMNHNVTTFRKLEEVHTIYPTYTVSIIILRISLIEIHADTKQIPKFYSGFTQRDKMKEHIVICIKISS